MTIAIVLPIVSMPPSLSLFSLLLYRCLIYHIYVVTRNSLTYTGGPNILLGGIVYMANSYRGALFPCLPSFLPGCLPAYLLAGHPASGPSAICQYRKAAPHISKTKRQKKATIKKSYLLSSINLVIYYVSIQA